MHRIPHRHPASRAPSHRPCCPMHMMMGADRRPPADPNEPPPSFVDGPAREPSGFCDGSDANTRDLFEVAAPGRPVVIRGANVVTMNGAGTLPNHDVIVVDGIIRVVEPGGGSTPDNAVEIDAVGKYLLPGLSEMHCHPPLVEIARMYGPMFGVENPANLVMPYDLTMFLYLAAGVTRIEVMAGTPEVLGLREHVRAKRLRGPTMRIASPIIDGFPFFFGPAITWGVGDPDGARQAARLIKERGYDFAKPYTRLKDECYWPLIEECEALGIPVLGHIPTDVDVEQALARGQRGIAHVFEYFWHEEHARRIDPSVIERKAKLSAERSITVQTTILAGLALEYDVGLAPGAIDSNDFLDPLLKKLMADDSPFLQGWRNDPEMVEGGRDAFKASVDMTKALVAEGVRILPGTDVPPNLTGPLSLQDELEMYVRDVGLAPIDALRAATIESADHQGEAAVAGTIEPGKRSDLILLEGDPIRDINATRDIFGVMLGDAYLSRAALDRGIERVKARYAEFPIAD